MQVRQQSLVPSHWGCRQIIRICFFSCWYPLVQYVSLAGYIIKDLIKYNQRYRFWWRRESHLNIQNEPTSRIDWLIMMMMMHAWLITEPKKSIDFLYTMATIQSKITFNFWDFVVQLRIWIQQIAGYFFSTSDVSIFPHEEADHQVLPVLDVDEVIVEIQIHCAETIFQFYLMSKQLFTFLRLPSAVLMAAVRRVAVWTNFSASSLNVLLKLLQMLLPSVSDIMIALRLKN